jgi:hypothetical protein
LNAMSYPKATVVPLTTTIVSAATHAFCGRQA